MEAVVGIVMFVVVMAGVFLGGLALMMANFAWWAWWLYPAWAWFLEPLGVPHVSFWMFVGIAVLLRQKPSFDFPEESKTRKWNEWLGLASGAVLGPIFVWVFLRWVHGLA